MILSDKTLNPVAEKVMSNQRINQDDALRLFRSNDIISIGRLADYRLKSENNLPDEVYYSYNLNINPTNICELRCKLCAFSKSAGEAGAYELKLSEMIDSAKMLAHLNPDEHLEVHIVGGLHAPYNLDFYEKLLSEIKAIDKKMSIQAFTAVEIDYMAKKSGTDIKTTLKRLKEAGLDAMPGGGAEIFSDRTRKDICEKKISGEKWLAIMKEAHELNIPTNATMLYGHIETDQERVEHMKRLRDLQDETGGFKSFVPLSFHESNTRVKKSRCNTGFDDLKVLAIARIFLDNFQNIKALHNTLGLKFAQIALFYGANDLGGTAYDEKIIKAAGALADNGIVENDIITIIKAAGKIPVRTDSAYLIKNRRA